MMISRSSPDFLMLEAAYTNDWAKAVEVISMVENVVVAANLGGPFDRKPLHGASAMGHTDFVRNFCSLLPDSEIAARDSRGNTALHPAAVSGNIEVASILLARNRDLLGAVANEGDTPISLAARCRQTQMFEFLFKMVRPGPNGDLRAKDWFRLLLIILGQDMFQTALVIMDMNDSVTTATILHLSDSKVGTVLHGLAVKTGGEKCLNELVDRVWSVMRGFEQADLYSLICSPKNRPVLVEAARVGNLAFIQKLFKENRDYIWGVDKKGHTLFHVAVLYRRYEILRWLDEIDDEKSSMKARLAQMQDVNGNCLLHLAALSANGRNTSDEHVLLFRLRKDFNLFQDVKKMAPGHYVHMKNNAGFEPCELFEREHAAMAKTSKKWKNEASQRLILIAFMMMTGPLMREEGISGSLKGLVLCNTMATLIISCYLQAREFSLRQHCKFVPWADFIGFVLFGFSLLGYLMEKIIQFTVERVWTWPSIACEAINCIFVLGSLFGLYIYWCRILGSHNVLWRRRLYV